MNEFTAFSFCYRYPGPPFSFFTSLSPHLLSRRPFLLLSFSVSPYKPSQNAIHHILLSSAPLSASLSRIISSSHRRVDTPSPVKINHWYEWLWGLNLYLGYRRVNNLCNSSITPSTTAYGCSVKISKRKEKKREEKLKILPISKVGCFYYTYIFSRCDAGTLCF